MNLELAIATWNSAIELRGPNLGRARELLGVAELTPVFANTCEFLYGGNNFVVRLRPGSRLVAAETPVQSMTLVLSANYFRGSATVKTEDFPEVTLLGIRIPCNAQRVLDHLRGLATRQITTSTERDRWGLRYGHALGFMFRPLVDGQVADTSQSRMMSIEFNFGPSHAGELSAALTEWTGPAAAAEDRWLPSRAATSTAIGPRGHSV